MSISRRQFLTGSAATFCAAPLLAETSTQQSRRRPNILFLMDDQHRGDCLGCDGNSVIQTPHLDRLKDDGAHFNRAYTSVPSCTPARAGLLTGQSPWGHGMLGYHKIAEQYPVEMPRLMAEAGYYTMAIGKCHFTPQRNSHGYHKMILDESGREQSIDFRSDYRSWLASVDPNADPDVTGIGFNSYRAGVYQLPDEYHPTHWTGQTAINFLTSYRREEPFFLKVSFARPHSPYDPPQRFMDLYKDRQMPTAHLGDWSEKMYGSFTKPTPDTLARGNLGAQQVNHSRQGYYGSVSFIDEQVGRILETLEARGLLDNTLVLFTSDHGDMTGDHHLWRKCQPYEASARVPMLVRWPSDWLDAPRGQTLSQPVELRDILPTFLDAAGIDVPDAVEGASMLGPISGRTDGWREFIDCEHATCYYPENVFNSLCDGTWKYIYHPFHGEHQLFNLDEDPGETRDLAGDPQQAARLRSWQRRMADHLAVRGDRWVRNGELTLRTKRQTTGPNYPG